MGIQVRISSLGSVGSRSVEIPINCPACALSAANATTRPIDLSPYSSQSLSRARGSRGDAVRTLQTALQAIGCDPNGVDGVFGPGTERAVKCMQTKAGIQIDGKVGRQTWAALHNLLNPTAAVPVPSPGGAAQAPPLPPPAPPVESRPVVRAGAGRIPWWGWVLMAAGVGGAGVAVARARRAAVAM